jgi:membrane protein
MHLYNLKRGTELHREPVKVKKNASHWKLGGFSPWQLCRRVYKQSIQDELLTRSAALSFYFAYALFPMLLFLFALLGSFARSAELQAGLFHYASGVMPPSAFALLQRTVKEIAIHSTGTKMALGLGLALWSASTGVSSIMDALNHCYNVTESRPYWKRQLLSVALTILISVLTVVDLIVVLYGSAIAEFVGRLTGLEHAAVTAWQVGQWPVAVLFLLITFSVIYHWGPDVKQPWRWFAPGTVTGVMIWIGVSFLFRTYLHYFSRYSKTYGSVGAAIVLLLWLFLTGLAILVGGEITAEIDKANAQRGPAEAKKTGKKVA